MNGNDNVWLHEVPIPVSVQAPSLDQGEELVPMQILLEEKITLMQTANVSRALRARHPLDELRIRGVVYKVCTPPMSANDIETLWSTYSTDEHGEYWTLVDDEELGNFESWLRR